MIVRPRESTVDRNRAGSRLLFLAEFLETRIAYDSREAHDQCMHTLCDNFQVPFPCKARKPHPRHQAPACSPARKISFLCLIREAACRCANSKAYAAF